MLLHLLSFPTRRSSDLRPCAAEWVSDDADVVDDEPDGPAKPTGHRNRGSNEANDGEGEERPKVYIDRDRKSTRLNSSHVKNSYAVFCLKKKRIKSIILP